MIIYGIGAIIFFIIATLVINDEENDIDLEFNSLFIQTLVILLLSLAYPILILISLLILIDERKR